MTASELIDTLYLYYPVGRTWEDHAHDEHQPEMRRLQAKWDQALARLDTWRACLRRMQEELGFPCGDATAYRGDPGFRGCLYVREVPKGESGTELLLLPCVSLLAPVCFVYGASRFHSDDKRRLVTNVDYEELHPDAAPHVPRVVEVLKSFFDCELLSPKLVNLPVPDICLDHFQYGGATVFKALFTWEPENIP